MSAAASRRKPRVCTREACETCREKKSKCDGEQPCSRCEARGIECHYQVRNHRSKRSLRNELNALKEKQRLQETLLAALQDPQRRDAALRLLETDDPMAGVDALFPPKDQDPDAQQQHQADFDDAGRSTTGSPSPSPRMTNVQHFAPSPLRSNSVVSSIAARSDSFPMPGMGDAYADHMNPFTMNANSPIYGQFATPFPGAPKNGMPFSGPGAAGNVFAPAWLDPSLNADNTQAQQQQNHPYAQQPMTDWDGGMDESFRNAMGGGGGNPGIMMAQGGPHQLPQTSSNLSHLGQWDSSAGTVIPSNGNTSRRLSRSHDSASSVPSANSVPSLASSGTSSLVSQASFAPPPPPAKTTRKQRPSVSSVASTNSQPRSQSRERHRLASARNWHKQKQATVDLQATKMRVEAQHAALREEYNEVLGQVQQIKHALLGHAACNDPAIKMWLKREADGVMTGYQQPGEDHGSVGDMSAPFTESLAPDGAPTTDDGMMRGVEVNVRA